MQAAAAFAGPGGENGQAIASGLTVKELVMKKRILEGKELEEVLNLRAMTEPGVPGQKEPPPIKRPGGR